MATSSTLVRTDPQTLLVTQHEVADLFRVSPRTVRRWAQEGWLHPVRIAGTTRFRRTDVDELLDPSNGTRQGDHPDALQNRGRHPRNDTD